MHGLDLPWIYSLLMHPRITGHLNIVTAEGDVIGVAFQRGNIVQVALQDTRSYFGVLLVERGFISAGDLDAAMRGTGQKTKRIGDHLVDMNLLSPHAIQIVVADQQGIRLSKTIANTSVKTNFIEAEDLREDAELDRNAYNELLHEWVQSKFSIDWLKAFYMPWMRWTIVKAQEWSDSHRAFQLPLLASAPDFAPALLSGKTLEQTLEDAHADEAAFYRRLHLLILARIVAFGEATRAAGDYAMLRRRLTRLKGELQKQTHFERLGVSPKAKAPEIKRAYHELAKVLHPDKLDPETPPDVRDLTRECFACVSQAYEVLSDEDNLRDYVRGLEQGNSEKAFEAESLAESAKAFLAKGDVTRALGIFEEAIKLAPPSVDLRLHVLWAKLKQPGKERDLVTLKDVRAQMTLIPPEDRHSAIYLFVKGLLLKASDEPISARRAFENAVGVDPEFIAARRELNLIRLQAKPEKNADLLTGDLRDVVGKLFKKKK
jgi:tetratricopeptide (TPR) repeat protein